MKEDKQANEKQAADDVNQALMYAQLAIFVGELLSQTEPQTPDGGYTFSSDALEGLSLLCNETGHNLNALISAVKKSEAK